MGMPTMLPLVRREEVGPGDHPADAQLPQDGGIPQAFRPAKAQRGKATVGRRNRGNPNWGKIRVPSDESERPTGHWMRKNAKLSYVPEYLLKAIGEEVRPEDVL